jgi:hypothetical protein
MIFTSFFFSLTYDDWKPPIYGPALHKHIFQKRMPTCKVITDVY